MADKYYTDENGVTFNESGELVADIIQQQNDIEVDQETANMENLAVTSPAKYMSTYNKPRDWVLDEKEARLAQIQRNAWTPDEASRAGALKYGFKQFLIDTYDTPKELGSALALGAAKIEDAFYPNADTKAIQRWYDNYSRLDVESDQIVNEYMSSHAGQHPYWLMGGAVALGLARDMAVAGGFAKLGASAATKAATKKVAERYVGEEIATRYTSMAAAQGAKKAGTKAITTSVFAQEFGGGTTDDIVQYIEKTGDKDLKYYDPSVDLAVNLGVALLSAQIEKGLGVERYVPRLVAQAVRRGEKVPALAQVLMRGAEGGIGEMSEEALQEGLSQFGDMIKGYREWWDWDSDQIATSAVLGSIGGTGAGAGLHYINRRIAINRLKAEGLDENTAADLIDTVIGNETNKTLNNLSAVNELKTQNGQAYEKLKSAMKRALETQGWKDKVIKDGVPMDIDEYVSLNAKDFIKPAIYYSNKYNIPIDLFLDVAEFTGFNNVLVLRDLGTTEQIKAKIDAQTNIIKTQQDLKKTGAGDSQLLSEAKVKKAILQKAYINATLSKEIQKVNLEESKTPEIEQEINKANEDADILTKTESVEDFNIQMDNKIEKGVPVTTDQKNKRFGNVVIKRIFGKDKFGFDSVMTLPEYANAKQGIVKSAAHIFDFVKKHRTYGLYTDLRNALNQMQTVNKGNFVESITTPSLDGKDVIAQNAFLYHFLFSEPNTISAYIDAYVQRAEASINGETKSDLSKKDLVGQSFEAVDKLMQVKAESAEIEYASIYNEDGSLADKNVAAVFVSYENQFLVEPSKTTILEQKDIVSDAKEQDYDGVIARNILDLGYSATQEDTNKIADDYVAFEPNQIKSVDNRGTYSDKTRNVYYQSRATNGFFDPELSAIVLGKNFNTMTLPHEMAHYWLDTLFNVYKRMQAGQITANAGFMQEIEEMFDTFGIDKNQENLTKGQHEKFARMTEAYLTGIGVNPDMNATYKAYLKWIPEKYKSLQQLAYLDDQGRIKLPFLDQKAVDFFNRWYENPLLPSLSTSPERQSFMNATGENGEVVNVSVKEMNNREKEFAQDAEEQIHTDERLYNTLEENLPGDVKATADAQKVVINDRSNFLKESQAQQKEIKEEPERRWYERKSRETEIQKAKEYLANNLDHAKDVIYGDPEFVPNDTGVDRATLINTYMALNNITPQHPDWATLHTNIAINQSLAGTQLALSNDKSYGAYLDALREVENALELKAATNYAGSKRGARERFNTDIQRFLDRELPSVFATEPNSKEREQVLRMMFEKARTTFSGNTTGTFLNQVDLDYAKSQKTKTEAFMRWAINQIKKDAGAKLSNEQQAKLLDISAKAQQALVDLDNPDSAKAVAAALEIIKWQVEKNKMMGVSPKKFSLFGDWAPRAMLASFNTLLISNPPSTFMNTWIVRALRADIFGKNKVSNKLIEDEIKRIKAIYNASGMNLAQMEKPTSPSLLHGEKYSASGQKWYDPYTILGREDNFFRVPTFVNTLARIASTDAQTTGRNADELFREYLSLSNQTNEAKLARKQALAIANMAVFTQNGGLANCLNHIRSELNRLSRSAVGLDEKGFGLGSLLAPFLTTGANIAEMGIRGALAPVTTLATMVNKWRTGKTLDPMKKLALRMDWTYFVFSAVSMALLAALTSDDDEFYTDPYVTGRKYDPNKPYDSINLGGVWIDLDFFGPFAIPMRTAAKAIQEWKKDNGILAGYGESAKTVLSDIPLAESIINNQVSWATKKPGDWIQSYAYNQANKLVPSIIKPASRAISRGANIEFEAQDVIGRVAGRKFHRNYGFDGAELTTQDLIEILTIKAQLSPELNEELTRSLLQQTD